jgi:lipid-A-disaccharide synthase-like uncharacterized protein
MLLLAMTLQEAHALITADSPFWTVFGFIGQALFASRFVLQWYVSEKLKQSVIPRQFWHLSIGGSIMMLIYALHLWKFPLIAAFLFPVFIYVRNLKLSRPAVVGTPADSDAAPELHASAPGSPR